MGTSVIRLKGIERRGQGQGVGIRQRPPGRPPRHAGNRPRRQLRQPPPRRGPPRRHGWWVRDLESTNGTYVNGVRLGPRRAAAAPPRHRPVRQGRRDGRAAGRDAADRRRRRPPTRSSSRPRPVRPGRTAFERLLFDRNHCPAAGRPAAWPCCGPGTTSSTSRAKTNCSTRSSTTPSTCSTPSAGRSCWPTGPDDELKLQGPGHRPRRALVGRFHFSQRLAQRCFSQGESILCCSVEEDEELPRRQSASPTGRWPRSCACCCGRRASSSACCTWTAASGRSRSPRTTCTWPTPWPPTSRPASSAPSCSAEQRDLFLKTIIDAGPGGRTARRVHRRPHRRG